MAVIFQTTFSYAFSWMKEYIFWLRFHWSLFSRFSQQYSSIGSDNGFAPFMRQAIIWINDGLDYWRIYASPGLNEWKASKVELSCFLCCRPEQVVEQTLELPVTWFSCDVTGNGVGDTMGTIWHVVTWSSNELQSLDMLPELCLQKRGSVYGIYISMA